VKVFITGATGFVGQQVAQALVEAGHDVVCAVRDPARLRLRAGPDKACAVAVDFGQATTPHAWIAHLDGVHVVINAVGIFRETADQRFDVIHVQAPCALFDAARAAGVPCVIQLSALGADDAAASAFHLSKKAADDYLLQLAEADQPPAFRAVVVQPSLVYGPRGASASLFNRLACLPLLVLPRPAGGEVGPWVQPVLLTDVVDGFVALVAQCAQTPRQEPRHGQVIAFVGPEPLLLGRYLARLRHALGFERKAWAVRVPAAWCRAAATVAARWPGSVIDADAVDMLLRGNVAPASRFAALLGRAPQPVEAFVPVQDQQLLRRSALVDVFVPVLRLSVALVWIWTGIVSLGLYPVTDSLALLARVGAQGLLAYVLLYGAALLDFALGWATLMLAARWRPALWLGQMALIAGYTLIISLRLPEFWLHPYGPLLKNLPMLAVIALLYALEEPQVRGDRRAPP
jgi:uncharacterized protein YbjT (DUF2867 family)